jgi:hypothetical protein
VSAWVVSFSSPCVLAGFSRCCSANVHRNGTQLWGEIESTSETTPPHTHTHDHLSLGPILAYPTATRLRAKVVSQKGTRESRLKVDGPCQSTWKLSLKTYNYYYHQRLCVSRQTVIIIHVPFRRQALFCLTTTTTTTAKTKLLVHTWWTKSFVTWQRIWCRLNDRWFPNRASLVE